MRPFQVCLYLILGKANRPFAILLIKACKIALAHNVESLPLSFLFRFVCLYHTFILVRGFQSYTPVLKDGSNKRCWTFRHFDVWYVVKQWSQI